MKIVLLKCKSVEGRTLASVLPVSQWSVVFSIMRLVIIQIGIDLIEVTVHHCGPPILKIIGHSNRFKNYCQNQSMFD
jgi:hypothetical protein